MARTGWRGKALAVILGAVGLYTGCGTARREVPAPPPPRVVRLTFPAHTLAALPLYVATAAGAFARRGLTWTPEPGGATLGVPGRWPVRGFLLVRPDWVLVSRAPDPAFRWRDLRDQPVAVAGLDDFARTVVDAVLAEHGVRTVAWEPLDTDTALALFRRDRIPWLLLPLLPAEVLVHQHEAHIVQYVGAATGPLPSVVLAGPAPASVLAALNDGLVYLDTHPAAQIATLVAADYPGVPLASLEATVAEAQGLGLFPASTFPDRATYEAATRFLAAAGTRWPDYASAVDSRPAKDALGQSP
jgi:hypothetical protein